MLTVNRSAQEKASEPAVRSAEMTMFVDPNAIKKAQESGVGRRVLAIQQAGGREANCNLIKEETLIGSDPSSDIPIKGLFIKPIQAKVIKAGGGNDRLVAMGGLRSVKVNGPKLKSTNCKLVMSLLLAKRQLSTKNCRYLSSAKADLPLNNATPRLASVGVCFLIVLLTNCLLLLWSTTLYFRRSETWLDARALVACWFGEVLEFGCRGHLHQNAALLVTGASQKEMINAMVA